MAARSSDPGCPHHPGTGFIYICMDCNEDFACMKCVIDVHKNHNLNILGDYAQTKREELQVLMENLTTKDNPKLQKDIKWVDEKINVKSEETRSTMADIRHQGEKIKNDIDSYTDKLVKLCNDTGKWNKDVLLDYKSVLQDREKANIATVRNYRQILKTGSRMDVIQTSRKLRCVPLNFPSIENLKSSQFSLPTQLNPDLLEHMFGHVTIDGLDEQYRVVHKPTIISQFSHSSHVTCCRAVEKHAWMSYWIDNDVYKVDQNGKMEKKIRCNRKVRNIAISPTTGRIWFCCYQDKIISEIMNFDEVVSRIHVDNCPGTLCILPSNVVVVGMAWEIRMYTTDGQEVNSTVLGGPCRQKVMTPIYMAYCTETGDIAVVDIENVWFSEYIEEKVPDKQPHVKIMNSHLNIKFCYPRRYSSTRDNDTRTLFYPSDVCFQEDGDVLVADYVTKSVILIDGFGGDHIRTIYMDSIKVLSISLQSDGKLWLTTEDKRVTVLKYKQ